jgi:hypothetical protein
MKDMPKTWMEERVFELTEENTKLRYLLAETIGRLRSFDSFMAMSPANDPEIARGALRVVREFMEHVERRMAAECTGVDGK